MNRIDLIKRFTSAMIVNRPDAEFQAMFDQYDADVWNAAIDAALHVTASDADRNAIASLKKTLTP